MLEAKRVASGTYGELWWDGEKIAECYKFEAKYTKNKEDVAMCGQFITDSKVTSAKGPGTIGIYHVYSRWASYADAVQQGKDERTTFIGKLDDPDGYGAERVALYGVSFDEVPLTSFEAGQIIKQEVPFTFTGHKFLEKASVS